MRRKLFGGPHVDVVAELTPVCATQLAALRRAGFDVVSRELKPRDQVAALTPAMRDLLLLIQRAIDRTQIAPTRREIAALLGGRSISTINYQLHALAQRGWIEMLPAHARAITLLRRLPDQPAPGDEP